MTAEAKKTVAMATKTEGTSSTSGRVLQEIVLNESIRYADKDAVEKWLNDLLCLDATEVPRMSSGCPLPELCDLYYVNRDTLFSYHKASEAFLHRIMGLYVSSHYKVSKLVYDMRDLSLFKNVVFRKFILFILILHIFFY